MASEAAPEAAPKVASTKQWLYVYVEDDIKKEKWVKDEARQLTGDYRETGVYDGKKYFVRTERGKPRLCIYWSEAYVAGSGWYFGETLGVGSKAWTGDDKDMPPEKGWLTRGNLPGFHYKMPLRIKTESVIMHDIHVCESCLCAPCYAIGALAGCVVSRIVSFGECLKGACIATVHGSTADVEQLASRPRCNKCLEGALNDMSCAIPISHAFEHAVDMCYQAWFVTGFCHRASYQTLITGKERDIRLAERKAERDFRTARLKAYYGGYTSGVAQEMACHEPFAKAVADLLHISSQGAAKHTEWAKAHPNADALAKETGCHIPFHLALEHMIDHTHSVSNTRMASNERTPGIWASLENTCLAGILACLFCGGHSEAVTTREIKDIKVMPSTVEPAGVFPPPGAATESSLEDLVPKGNEWVIDDQAEAPAKQQIAPAPLTPAPLTANRGEVLAAQQTAPTLGKESSGPPEKATMSKAVPAGEAVTEIQDPLASLLSYTWDQLTFERQNTEKIKEDIDQLRSAERVREMRRTEVEASYAKKLKELEEIQKQLKEKNAELKAQLTALTTKTSEYELKDQKEKSEVQALSGVQQAEAKRIQELEAVIQKEREAHSARTEQWEKTRKGQLGDMEKRNAELAQQRQKLERELALRQQQAGSLELRAKEQESQLAQQLKDLESSYDSRMKALQAEVSSSNKAHLALKAQLDDNFQLQELERAQLREDYELQLRQQDQVRENLTAQRRDLESRMELVLKQQEEAALLQQQAQARQVVFEASRQALEAQHSQRVQQLYESIDADKQRNAVLEAKLLSLEQTTQQESAFMVQQQADQQACIGELQEARILIAELQSENARFEASMKEMQEKYEQDQRIAEAEVSNFAQQVASQTRPNEEQLQANEELLELRAAVEAQRQNYTAEVTGMETVLQALTDEIESLKSQLSATELQQAEVAFDAYYPPTAEESSPGSPPQLSTKGVLEELPSPPKPEVVRTSAVSGTVRPLTRPGYR